MTTSIKWLIGIVVAAIAGVILGAMFFHSQSAPVAGAINNGAAVQNYPYWFTNGFYGGSSQQFSVDSSGAMTLGSSGTKLSSVIATTCTGIVYASLTGTSTQSFDCAVTGALTTAKFVGISIPNGATYLSTNAGIIVWGGHASTTAGYVSGYITNLSGVATSSYAQATTSMPVLVIQ